MIHLTGEHVALSLPQGKYKVKLQASGLAGTLNPMTTSTKIQVKDVLIVSIGDSFASGEGDPVVPANDSSDGARWAYSPDPAMNQQNADAHRSTISGPAGFALALQEENPHEAVTFVSVANSGASISQGLLGPMRSVGNPRVLLPAEIAELKDIIGSRRINVLTLSVGGNDIGFTDQVESLIENTATGNPSRSAIDASVSSDLKTLPGLYARLNKAIKGLHAATVLVTDYPNQFLNQDGVVSSIPGPFGTTLISTSDAQFATQAITIPLNNAIAAAATKFNGLSLIFSPVFPPTATLQPTLGSASSTNRSTWREMSMECSIPTPWVSRPSPSYYSRPMTAAPRMTQDCTVMSQAAPRWSVFLHCRARQARSIRPLSSPCSPF